MIGLLVLLMGCSSDKTDYYSELSPSILKECSWFSISPNKKEVLLSIPENGHIQNAWMYMYRVDDLSLVDTCFVSNFGFIQWDNDSLVFEDGFFEEETKSRILNSKKAIGDYFVKYDYDTLSFKITGFISYFPPSYTFDRYKIDLDKEELNFFEKNSTYPLVEIKDFSKNNWRIKKQIFTENGIQKIEMLEGSFFNSRDSSRFCLKPKNKGMINQFYKDLFKEIQKLN